MTKRALTQVETAALHAFAKAHGRNAWRNELSQTYWYNARLWTDGPDSNMGSVLHGIRNEFGPTWLYDTFRLPPNFEFNRAGSGKRAELIVICSGSLQLITLMVSA